MIPEITAEHLLYLAGILATGIGAVWAFFVKVWFPVKQKQREFEAQEAAKQREHERAIALDKLEHEQGIEQKERNAQVLQASWREDKIAELLEKDSSFIREEALRYLRAIDDQTGKSQADYNKIDKGISDLLSKVDLLTVQEKRRAEAFTLQSGVIADLVLELRKQQTEILFIIEILKNQNNRETEGISPEE